MWRQALSLLVLALALLRTLLARLLVQRSSLERFEEHYSAEGIVFVTKEEARVLGRAGRCIACGLCDQVVSVSRADLGVVRRGSGDDPEAPDALSAANAPVSVMGFVLAGARCLTDFDVSSRLLDKLPEEVLHKAEAVCPRDVAIVDLSKLVLRHQARVLAVAQG